MASDILGLFTTPQQYERQRQADMEAQALQMARLSPREQGQFGIALGAQQLGRAIGGALGGVDPQLQKITQRQQLLGMIDPNNPDSYAQAIQTALQAGDQEAAFLLRNEMMRVQEQASVAEARRFEREGRLLERGLGMQKRGMESMALSLANGIDPETGQPTKPLFDPITRTFNQDVADQLISRFPTVGADIVKTRLESVQGIGSLQEKQAAKTQEAQALEKAKLLFTPDGAIDKNVYIELMTNFGQAGLDVLEKKLKGVQSVESLQEKQAAKSRTDKANELFGRLRKPDGTIDEEVKAQLLSFQEGRNLIEEQAKVLKPLRQLGAAGGAPEEDPFKIFLDDPTIPANVKTLANQYSSSFTKGMIDPEKVDTKVKELADMTQRIQQFEQNQAQIKANQDVMESLKRQGLENTQGFLAIAQSNQKLAEQNAKFQQSQKVEEANRKRQDAAEKADTKKQAVIDRKVLAIKKEEEEDFNQASEARNLAVEANDYVNSIKAGSIKFGLKDRASIAARSALGSSDPDVVARNDFERFKTRLVNESLRLNKGTQTEGDAQRSVKELQSAESAVDAAKAINKLAELNAKKVADKKASLERRRANLNIPPPEVTIQPLQLEPHTFTQQDVDAFLKNPKYPKGSIFVDPQGVRRVKP